ncbi:MAG: hypothetical protein JKP96_09280 [Oceanicaulis sp.]|jgi:hypothetical protein|nr:hypothetical protein [Oceanicaulis sp.]
MAQNTFGKLKLLKSGGSTSRVIDLLSVHECAGPLGMTSKTAMFNTKRLNTSFIVKHTLRPWEREQLSGARISATKIIIPISERNLDTGGHSIFVEDPALDEKLSSHLGVSRALPRFREDITRLRELSKLPSFDPYLLFDHFRLDKRPVSDAYFEMNERELSAISEFVAGQINLLVRRAMNSDQDGSLSKARKLASTLFEDHTSSKLDVLRLALNMSPEQYRDGVNGWKGTLYYCWRAGSCNTELSEFIASLKQLNLGQLNASDRDEYRQAMGGIARLAGQRWARVQNRLSQYHEQFSRFIKDGDGAALSQFLIMAPDMFVEMGEDMSRIQHVCASWRFWVGDRQACDLPVAEARSLLEDFDAALSLEPHAQAA